MSKSFEDSSPFMIGIRQNIGIKKREQSSGFRDMLLGILHAILFGNNLEKEDAVKGVEWKLKAAENS